MSVICFLADPHHPVRTFGGAAPSTNGTSVVICVDPSHCRDRDTASRLLAALERELQSTKALHSLRKEG